MKQKQKGGKTIPQPKPFTPGITRGMVRQRAYELYRDKLPQEPLTLENWVLAEKDLVQTLETDGLLKR
jgi:hypothetical protein